MKTKKKMTGRMLGRVHGAKRMGKRFAKLSVKRSEAKRGQEQKRTSLVRQVNWDIKAPAATAVVAARLSNVGSHVMVSKAGIIQSAPETSNVRPSQVIIGRVSDTTVNLGLSRESGNDLKLLPKAKGRVPDRLADLSVARFGATDADRFRDMMEEIEKLASSAPQPSPRREHCFVNCGDDVVLMPSSHLEAVADSLAGILSVRSDLSIFFSRARSSEPWKSYSFSGPTAAALCAALANRRLQSRCAEVRGKRSAQQKPSITFQLERGENTPEDTERFFGTLKDLVEGLSGETVTISAA